MDGNYIVIISYLRGMIWAALRVCGSAAQLILQYFFKSLLDLTFTFYLVFLSLFYNVLVLEGIIISSHGFYSSKRAHTLAPATAAA